LIFPVFRSLLRHPTRLALSLIGIAVTAALLLDMVMLSGGIERSFERLLMGRGFQIRISPKGTLPFDTEATMPRVSRLLERIRDDPAVESAGAVVGASVFARHGDSLVTLFGYGVDPAAQAIYQLLEGVDLAPGDTVGVLLSRTAAGLTHAGIGDTVILVSRLDPQVVVAARQRRLVVRGIVRWLFDYPGQPSIGTTVLTMQSLALLRAEDRASEVVVKVRDDSQVDAVTARIIAALPQVEVSSVASLVARFRARLVYFRQLSYILGSISLAVTVLLIGTLLTVGVNERLGEIVTLRAIGVSRSRIVGQIIAEGAALTAVGSAIGILLGLATAHYLDGILKAFPGLPAAISFFVPEVGSLTVGALVLLVSGTLAGGYPALLAARAPIAATLRAEAT
jgi:putative ABC transport system permease protein